MPAKYSHVKKRSASGLKKKAPNNAHGGKDTHRHQIITNHIDRTITTTMSAVSQLERSIARIFLIRYEQDIARLFSTHLFTVALVHLPTFMMRCISIGGPGWVAHNADCDEIKDWFRSVISMDMRQAGERVATKSVLWSYTALRDFAVSNNAPVCRKRGVQSLRLLPHYAALKAHLDGLQSAPHPVFSKPPHLGPLTEGLEALEEACEMKYGTQSPLRSTPPPGWDEHWRLKVQIGYERLSQTLWRVAREFDVRGYGAVLREKLTTKWCDCGCSTDHLGEVCERTVREDEESNGVRSGKQREWDGRGSGIFGWETEEEEDVWELDLDFGGDDHECEDCGDACADMTIGELMELRYLKAEREKELGNVAFRRGDFELAVQHYEAAYKVEPEMPHYQLNLAAAHLKLNNWVDAEKACTKALSQHRSSKGFFRRAKARKLLGEVDDAIKDLRAALKIQPSNSEAIAELLSLLPPEQATPSPPSASSSSAPSNSSSLQRPSNSDRLQLPKPKPPKQLPFARTWGDDRKIKIVAVPVTFEVPVPDASCPLPPALAKASGSSHPSSTKTNPQPSPAGPKAAKPKAEIPNSGVKVKTQKESFVFPSWEKYVVKQVVG
ncbi:hypothetical protein BV22DRAFT_1132596 [Leucogyrophana mollusca]|uniref:Uncharacterized protein n=1 Tax=Leucogyrophana mollusca TaxID=85980 RepID=A0ACB8B801_9AGAM|nr:hypothetical protein BV22DRAFT_1132596 [Leucogyrophana mollusca]